MFQQLIALPTLVFTLIIIVASVSVALFGLYVGRRFLFKAALSSEESFSANVLIRLIGAILSVLLAFVVFSAWSDYEEQRKRVVLEACDLGNIYRDSRGLGFDEENNVQKLTKQYTYDIVHSGWPELALGRESRKSWMSFNLLYGEIIRYEPTKKSEEIIFDRMLHNLNELAAYRRMRIIRNENPHIPNILWGTILISGLLTLTFSYMIVTPKSKLQKYMIAMVGFMFGLVFSMIILLNYPYRSSIKISPYPFEKLLDDVFPTAEITATFNR